MSTINSAPSARWPTPCWAPAPISCERGSPRQASASVKEASRPYNDGVSSIDPRLAPFLHESRPPGLRLLILFGSRARGDAADLADWDFGYLADRELDLDRLLAGLGRQIDSDRIDLVDLARAGGQLRYRAARDGRLLYEASPGEFARFWTDAVTFWCDAAAVLGPAYADVLDRLAR